jgi:hypothetical protein
MIGYIPCAVVAVAGIPVILNIDKLRSNSADRFDDVLDRLESEIQTSTSGKEWQKSGFIAK